MPNVHCKNCNKEMEVSQNRIDNGRGKFCSRFCHAQYTFTGMKRPPQTQEHIDKLRDANIGRVPWNKGNIKFEKVCQICGKTFDIPQSRIDKAKYCSRQCQHEAKRRITGTNHKLFNRVKMACEICGKLVWVKHCKIGEFRFCSRQCQGVNASAIMAERNGPTSIEKSLMDELDRQMIHYIPQHKIANWLVDISLPQFRIAIEADGNYWHSTVTQQEKDRNKDRWLIAHKWTVFRFTETEINDSPSRCIDIISAHIKRLQG